MAKNGTSKVCLGGPADSVSASEPRGYGLNPAQGIDVCVCRQK